MKMFLINRILVSAEIITKRFSCDISECRGICCCDGEYGAPVEFGEIEVLQSILKDIVPYLSEESNHKIKAEGVYKRSVWGGYETPLSDDGSCVYAVEKNGIVFCGIELAWKDGKITFRKPISCHLYPVRVRKLGIFECLVYEHWDVCRSHNSENTPLVFEFVSDALQRKYGADFVDRLKEIAYK